MSGVRPPVDLIGAEKTGTNLLARLLGLLGYTTSKSSVSRFIPSSPDDTLGYSEAEFMSDPERIYIWPWPKAGLPRSLVVDTLGQLGPSTYAHSHAPYSPELEQILIGLGHSIVMTIRDPRDAALSMARWFADPGSPDNIRRHELGGLEPERRLAISIAGTRLSNGAGVPGIAERFAQMEGWRLSESVCVVRFEDLVGSQGGGSDAAQQRAVTDVAAAVGRALTPDKATKISDKLFGRSATFRSGRIGSWRKSFTPEMVALFKEHANDLLIRLGYETSPDWDLTAD